MNQLHYKELRSWARTGHRTGSTDTMDYLNRRREECQRRRTHRFPLEEIGQAFETIRSGAG